MTTPRWRSVRLALGTASALGLSRFSYGLVLPAMAEDLDWDLTLAGVMTTANGLGYLVGAMLTAPTARRLGTATTFRVGMVLCVLALAATAASGSYPALLAARTLAGIGGAYVFVTGAVLCPSAIFFAGTGLGIALSGAGIPLLLDQRPERWPLAWIGLAAAAALCAIAAWTAAGTDRPAAAGATRRPSPIRPLLLVAAAYTLFAAGYITYITFLSVYLADHDVSTGLTALTWSLLGLAVIAAPVLWQRPLTTWGGGRVLTVLLGTLTAAAALCLLSPTPPVLVGSVLAYGATFMAVPAAVTTYIHANSPADTLIATMATFTVIFAIGQAAGPWAAGAIADLTSTGATLAWTAALCGIGAVLAGLSYVTEGRAQFPRVRDNPAERRQARDRLS